VNTERLSGDNLAGGIPFDATPTGVGKWVDIVSAATRFFTVGKRNVKESGRGLFEQVLIRRFEHSLHGPSTRVIAKEATLPWWP
jgi:hypothetical protein